MIRAATTTSAPTDKPGALDVWAQRLFVRKLASLRHGQISLVDALGTTRFGASGERTATVMVRDPRFYRRAVVGGSLALAESYIDGQWDCDDLTTLLSIFARDLATADQLDGRWRKLAQLGHRMWHACRANSRRGSQRNIAAHYDLSNEFFGLWLDGTWAYSSGIFTTREATLADASTEKFDRVCRKLELQPRDEVLEIGGGWGGFALHAAAHYGCRVTTTTISRRQFEAARERIDAAGLAARVRVLQCDYRDLAGQFDKLVSIEMIEAVGYRYLDSFFGQCGRLLKPDGTFVLQGIVMPERRYADYLRSVDFIQRHVFPGGCLPSIGAMLESVGRTSDMRLVHAEDFGPHYAETLRRWRQAFHARLDEVRRLGFDERFIRMWTYYLCYCEAAFDERCVGVMQLQFDKRLCRRDPLAIGRQAAARMNDRAAASCDREELLAEKS